MQKVSAATARPQQRPAGKQPVSQSQRPKPKTDHESFKEEDTENVSDFLGIVSAGLTVFSMIVGAKAQQAYELAENEEDQKKNKKKFDKSQTMQLDAAAVAIHAEGVAAGVAEIADKNDFIGALVGHLETVNGVAGIGVAVLPLVYQLMANHAPPEARDNMPPQLMQLGVLPPQILMEKLKAQNSTKMAKVQADILREQKQAEQETAKLREEISEMNGRPKAAAAAGSSPKNYGGRPLCLNCETGRGNAGVISGQKCL